MPAFDLAEASLSGSTQLFTISVSEQGPAGPVGNLLLGETSTTAYRGDRGKTAYDHSLLSGNPHATNFLDLFGSVAVGQLPFDVVRKSQTNTFTTNQLITGTLGVSGALTSGSLLTGNVGITGELAVRGGLTHLVTTTLPQGPSTYTAPQKATFEQGWQMNSSGGTPSYDSIYPDNIFQFGWNSNGLVHGEPRMRIDFESAFRNGIGAPDMFEMNLNIYTQNNLTLRQFGMTMPRADLSAASKNASEAGFYFNTFSIGSIDDSFISNPTFVFNMKTTASPGKKLVIGADGSTTTHILLNSANVPMIKQSVGGGDTINLPYGSTFEGLAAIKSELPLSCQYNSVQQSAIFAYVNQSGVKFLSDSGGLTSVSQLGNTCYFNSSGQLIFRLGPAYGNTLVLTNDGSGTFGGSVAVATNAACSFTLHNLALTQYVQDYLSTDGNSYFSVTGTRYFRNGANQIYRTENDASDGTGTSYLSIPLLPIPAKFVRASGNAIEVRATQYGATNFAVTGPGNITASGTGTLGIYTVATLPAASTNSYGEANVSDALSPAMGSTVVAGGVVKTKVRSNGTNWTVAGT